MEIKELRHKLILDFGRFIEDDSKLEVLEGVFDAINQEEINSVIPQEHYDRVSEEREKYLSEKSVGNTWEEVEKRLNTKYSF